MNDLTKASGSIAIIAKLKETQPWLKFIGILLIIGAGLLSVIGICISLFFGIGIMIGTEFDKQLRPEFMIFVGILYFVMSFIYFFPRLYLLRAAKSIREAAESTSESSMFAALEHQRRFWKFLGIAFIVGIVFYILLFLIAIIDPVIISAYKRAQ